MSAPAARFVEDGTDYLAAARSQVYRLFAEALEYPDSALAERIRSGQLAQELSTALSVIDSALSEGQWQDALNQCVSEESLQIEHTRLFDTAASKNACSLFESSYTGSRTRVLEESLRFYDYFGLRLADDAREMPDYLVTQLEFLHYLAYQQASLPPGHRDAQSFRNAEREFLARHLCLTVPNLRKQIKPLHPRAFYDEITRLFADFLSAALSPPSTI